MKIAFMGDIHGNIEALDRCVKEALWRGAEEFVFLGDYVADMPHPQRTLEYLYILKETYPCHFIKGNKEDYWINHRRGNDSSEWQDNCSASGMLYYTYSKLSDKDIDFFETLPICEKLEFEDAPAITVCHGSPYRANEDMIRGTDRMNEIIDASDTDLIICAHTHRQWKYEYNNKAVINPGSVGLPLGSEGKAQFLILENADGKWVEEYYSVTYNLERLLASIEEEDLAIHAPYWVRLTKKTLMDGKPYHCNALVEAMKLCEEETGACEWPRIPEKYWAKAAGF